MSIRDEGVSFSLEINVEPAYEDIRKLQAALSRTLGLITRVSGDEDLKNFIAKAQEAIRIANELRLTLAALQAVRLAAGDPFAWIMLGVSAGTVSVDLVNAMEMESPEY